MIIITPDSVFPESGDFIWKDFQVRKRLKTYRAVLKEEPCGSMRGKGQFGRKTGDMPCKLGPYPL
nr:hypothetical protein [uncultured Oscillibacter sp.]